MARKIVDIGVEGNDGTGDSIREAFRKTNENFRELYAVFGQEGTISFLDLGDTPNSYTGQANKVAIVSSDATEMQFKELIGTAGLEISYPETGEYAGKIVFENRSNSVENDLTPQLSGALNARGEVIGYVGDPTIEEVGQFNSKYGYSGAGFVPQSKFALNVGFADNRYVNLTGDVMTGHLSVPAGATNNQVPRANETVLKTGGSMTGKLYLNDHPGELAGAGTPNSQDDLQAATKYYVDNTAYSSKVNLYVSTDGDDAQTTTPPGREGRHWTYAYRTIGAACLKAEQLIKASPWEAGPYRQLIAYGNGAYFSKVEAIQIGSGLNGTTRVRFTNDSGNPVDQGVPENRDIIPGKIVIGRTSGARGFIVRYDTDGPQDYVDLRDITGTFQIGENLEFDQAVKRLEISIFVESGTYYEDYPIRLPQNVSLLGDEFRRTVVRPADRPSQSPWATTWFYRDLKFDGLDIAETNWGYHYLTDPTNKASLPKNNKDIDVFLCNDAVIIRQISCQGHGGFMMVLDPEGQILTKSPYAQQSGCFAGSLNKQAFRGGQYVDGMAGSLPVTTVSMNANKSEITVTDAFRLPQTPTSFFVEGVRYKIDTFTDSGEGFRNASELLTLNRDFIIEETIAYVNDAITPTFTYDQEKCSRDVGYILDAISWDIAFDTNIQTILVAQEYYYKRDGSAYSLLPNQKAATLDALGYVKDRLNVLTSANSTANSRVLALMDIVIGVVNNGLSAVPARVLTDPPAPTPPATNTDVINSLAILRSNREFIKAEYIAFITSTYGENFLFNVDTYQRDVDRIVNAVIYDAIYGGNSQSSLVARSFYDVNGNLLIADETTQIVNAINWIKNITYDVTLSTDIDYNKQSVVEQILGTPGTTTIANKVVALFDNLVAIILDLENGETITNPDPTNVSSGIKDAKAQIAANEAIIRAGTIEFINSRYLYDEFKASVDIGFIVDAIAHDILYTGNLKSVEQGLSYHVGDAPFVSDAERPRTLAILNYIELLALNIVQNIDIPTTPALNSPLKRRQFSIPQTIQLDYGQGAGAAVIEPSTAWVAASLTNAANLLLNAKSTLQANVIAYIDENYPTLNYDKTKCSRDIGIIIDALRYDLQFGSNFRSVKAGMAYYRANAATAVGAQKIATIDALEYLQASARTVVYDTVAARTSIDDNMQIIIDIVDGGLGAVPAFVTPDPEDYDIGYSNARRLIGSNKSFIVSEITAWINYQKTNNITPFISSFSYDVSKCERDVGYIVDALRYDLTYGGNLETLVAANSYFVGAVSQLGVGEKDETLATYAYLRTLINNVAKGIVITPTVGNNVVQDTSGTGATTDAADFASARIQDVYDTINIDALDSTPRVEELVGVIRDMITGTTGYLDARDLLVANRDFIKAEVTNYIDYKYTVFVSSTSSVTDYLTTNDTTNLRVGMPVEFVGPDPFDQEIIEASEPTGTGPYYVTFTFPRQRVAPDVSVEYEILNNTNANYNVITNAITSTTNTITLSFDTNPGVWGIQTTSRIRVSTGTFGGVTRGVKYYVKNVVDTNHFTISETINGGIPGSTFQLTTGTGNMKCTLSYDRNTCARDVGFIVSNISTDLLYGGRYNSIRTGLRYWANSAALVVGEQSPETLDGINFINTLAQRVITNTPADFSYNQELCKRDIGLILDAVTSDIIFNTNYATITAGLSYLRSYSSVVTSQQKEQTIAGITKAKQLALDLISTPATETALNNLVNTVIEIINTEALPNNVTLSYTNPANTSASVINAFNVIRANKQFLVEEIIAFINANLNPSTIPNYSEALCRRDVSVILDALCYDLLYGGSKMSVRAANAYLSGTLNVIATEGAQTAAAYNRLKTVLGYIIVNSTAWTKSTGNTATQNTSLVPGTASEVTKAQALVDPVIAIANTGDLQPSGVEPTFANGVNYATSGADRTTILGSIEGIKSGVISYLNIAYASSLTYQNLNNVVPEIFQTIDTSLDGSEASSAIDVLINTIYDIVEQGPAAVPVDKITYPKYVLQLSEETPYNEAVSGLLPDEIIIQSAGNTSMLSNDWTQLNDLGYGLVATNNGLIETVSVFTYYCWVAYFANNGGQIRSVGGSNAHGEYGLIAQGSDPFEVPDDVRLSDDMVQVVRIYKEGPYVAEMAKDKTVVYIDAYGHIPYNVSEIEINHGYGLTSDGEVTNIGVTRYEVSSVNDVSSTVFSTTGTTFASKTAIGDGRYRVVFNFPAKTYATEPGRYYTVSGNSVAAYNGTFLCESGSTTSITLIYPSDPGTFGSGTTAIRLKAATVLRLNLNTGGNNNTATSGLQKALTNNQLAIIRANQNFKFYNADRVNPTRPSTALTFRGDPTDDALAPVYRVLSFGTKDPLSNDLVQNDPVIKNEVILAFDSGYDYVDLVVAQDYVTTVESSVIEGGSGSRTLGSQVGDIYLAVEKITSSRDLNRIQTGEMIFAWNGRVHRIESYVLKTISSVESYGIIKLIEDRSDNSGNYQSLITSPATGITSPVKPGIGYIAKNGVYNNGFVTYTIPLLDAAPTSGVSYTVYGNENGSYNVSAVASGSTTTSITLPVNPATVIGSVNTSGVLTVNYVSGNTIQVGQAISGQGLSSGTTITAQLSGTAGGVGTYSVSPAPSTETAVFTASIASTTLTVTNVASGKLLVGATIQKTSGSGVTTNTQIVGQLTGTNSAAATTTATGSIGSYQIVVADATGIAVGQLVTGTGVPSNTYVSAVLGTTITLSNALTGALSSTTVTFRTAGLEGTYQVSVSQTVSSGTMATQFTAIPGTYGADEVTRIFPTATIYNPDLVDSNTITLKAGLSKGEPGDIIVNISTCRATSHDFLDIGSGGYNQTNYPSKVYGPGRQKQQTKEVVERGTGRVFWVSTDQDGFFRVGRFFTVDQGTGTVSFAASLALSNLDGLGFKRGRAISEFSDDDTFQDLAQDTVPTEAAVDGYINRRLGIDRENNIISDGTLGAGFLDRAGILSATGNINLGGNRLINVSTPVSGTDSTNKNYVDGQQLSDISVNTTGRSDNDVLVWNNDTSKWVNAKSSSINSQIQIDLIADKELNVYVKRETITNSQVSSTAAIAQEKLDLNNSVAQRDFGVKIASVTKSIVQTSTGAVISGKSPTVLVRFNLANALTVAPTTGIYYTVRGNSNASFNGTFYCVGSTNGAESSVTLVYPENPGIYGSDLTTYIVPFETEITTQLEHTYSVGDTVHISGSTVSAGTNINGDWTVMATSTANKLTIGVDTSLSDTFTLTSGRVTKVGLAAFNKNQFTVSDGFVGLQTSTKTTTTATVTAGSAVITNINSMANIAVGSVITLDNNFGTVRMPTTTAGATPTAISQAIPVTVASIDSATQITLSTVLAGTGAASGATIGIITGTPLSSIQQIQTDRIVGNLSGSIASPNVVTTGEVVEAGDGIKNAEFNGPNRIGYSNNNTTVLADDNADLNVHGLMTLRAIGTNSWQNTYGVFKVTSTGEGNSIVRTNNQGRIDATAYILDGKLAFDSSGSANIDMYTPGGALFLTATGASTNAANVTVNIGTLNESSVLSGLVTVPRFTAINTVTMNPPNASISMQPTGTGSVTINPANVGSINNMTIGSTTRSSAAFTTLTANNAVTFTGTTESTTAGTGVLVVSGGVGIAKNLNVGGSVVVTGNLTVNGITTTVNSSTLSIDDKNLELASVGTISPLSGDLNATTGVITNLVDSTNNAPSGLIVGMTLSKISGAGAFGINPTIAEIISQNSIRVVNETGSFTTGTINFSASGNSETTADGGGITLIASADGSGDKKITWVKATGRWTSNVGFEATSIQNTPIGSSSRESAAFTTLTANNSVTFTQGTDSSGTTTGTLVVTGGVGISAKLNVGGATNIGGATKVNNTLEVTGKTDVNNATEAAYTGTGPYAFSDGALRVRGGTVIEKKLVVFGAVEFLGGMTVTGSLSGSASQVNTQAASSNTDYFLTFVDTNNGTATGETVYTGAGVKVNPSTSTITATTFKGNLNGQADGADTVKTRTASDASGTFYLTFVNSNNALDAITNEIVYTDGTLAYDPNTNTLTTTTFSGSLSGNASSASQVKTQQIANTNAGPFYLTFVDTDNPSATNETVYTNGGLYFNPRDDILTTTTFSGTLSGDHKGNVVMDDGTGILVRGASAAASTFAGNAATATKLASAKTIELSGAVSGSATFDGSSAINISTTLGTITAAGSNTVKVTTNATTDQTYYLLFADGAGSVQRDINADTGAGGPWYNPNANTIYCSNFSGRASSANYADLAENYLADAAYEPGTVLVFGGENEVTVTDKHNDRRVAGVVSTAPGYLMNSELTGETVVALALQGRVPCKVVGPVKKGDILVTSAKKGYAIVNNDPVVGTVIGKAVGTKTDLGDGVVEVVVGRI